MEQCIKKWDTLLLEFQHLKKSSCQYIQVAPLNALFKRYEDWRPHWRQQEDLVEEVECLAIIFNCMVNDLQRWLYIAPDEGSCWLIQSVSQYSLKDGDCIKMQSAALGKILYIPKTCSITHKWLTIAAQDIIIKYNAIMEEAEKDSNFAEKLQQEQCLDFYLPLSMLYEWFVCMVDELVEELRQYALGEEGEELRELLCSMLEGGLEDEVSVQSQPSSASSEILEELTDVSIMDGPHKPVSEVDSEDKDLPTTQTAAVEFLEEQQKIKRPVPLSKSKGERGKLRKIEGLEEEPPAAPPSSYGFRDQTSIPGLVKRAAALGAELKVSQGGKHMKLAWASSSYGSQGIPRSAQNNPQKFAMYIQKAAEWCEDTVQKIIEKQQQPKQ